MPAPTVAAPDPSTQSIDRFLAKKYFLVERRKLKAIAAGAGIVAIVTGVGLWEWIREAVKTEIDKGASDRIQALESRAKDAVDGITLYSQMAKDRLADVTKKASLSVATGVETLVPKWMPAEGIEEGNEFTKEMTREIITFKQPFAESPKVVAMLSKLEFSQAMVRVTVTDIKKDGFTLVLETARDKKSPTQATSVTWLAVGQ